MFPYCISISSLLFSLSNDIKKIRCSPMDGSETTDMFAADTKILDLAVDMRGEYA